LEREAEESPLPYFESYRHEITPIRQHIITSWVFRLGFSSLERHLAGHKVRICPVSFREWLKFPLNGLRAQNKLSPAVGLLPLTSGPACFGMAFPPFLVKQLYSCDSVVISSFVRTGYATRR